MSSRSPADPERHPRGGLALAGTIGGYVALCILVGLGLGLVLDKLFGTAPVFLIVGVLVGFAASFLATYRLAMGVLED